MGLKSSKLWMHSISIITFFILSIKVSLFVTWCLSNEGECLLGLWSWHVVHHRPCIGQVISCGMNESILSESFVAGQVSPRHGTSRPLYGALFNLEPYFRNLYVMVIICCILSRSFISVWILFLNNVLNKHAFWG